ncbi:MAG: potassium/proton antiporter [Alphaproteobacteria bacterium]
MDLTNELIILGAGLILVSILAGILSNRFGAPLLLVFLVLGMLAGEDGPGGIDFDDFEATYLVGSIALAIILFDGGLRTRWRDLKSVSVSASVLASIGVFITAAVTGVAARFLLGVGWLEGILVGSIVASTDAAAVFLLLSGRGYRLRDRLRTILEAEAGLNDPMAVLLTVTCVGLLIGTQTDLTFDTVAMVSGQFVTQIAGGLLVGAVGGGLLLILINRLNIASGLYPIFAASGALLLFAGAQEAGASGFLAVYIAGLVVGNRRHKATLLINRFQDGLAWLSQIVMFLILGLLVTPSALSFAILPALGIAFTLIFIARPVAVMICLPVFRYDFRESLFVSWVGLRGAVPIFLGTIPVLAGVENAETYFSVIYIIVLASLLVQGWTIGTVGRRLGVLLPPRSPEPPRVEIDLPSDAGRDMAAYTVQPNSWALRRTIARMPIPDDVDIISVIRDGKLHKPEQLEHLSAGDDVLVMTPTDQLPLLDRLFGTRKPRSSDADLLGEFSFEGETETGSIADAYEFWVPQNQRAVPVADFLHRHLFGPPGPGQRIRLGPVELIVGQVSDGKIIRVHVELDPAPGWSWHRLDIVYVLIKSMFFKQQKKPDANP